MIVAQLIGIAHIMQDAAAEQVTRYMESTSANLSFATPSRIIPHQERECVT